MGNTTVTEVIGIFTAIIALAALGLILSKNSTTVGVVKQIGSTFNGALKVATEQK